MPIKVESSAFKPNGPIPRRHSAYGENISPPLTWSGLPDGVRQLALIVDDPVAPSPQPFVHWVVYHIPAGAEGLPEGLPPEARLKKPESIAGTTQGHNDLRRSGYFGPRPPKDGKTHTYHFKLYALDAGLDLAEGKTKEQLLQAMEGHILASGELVGTYRNEQ